MKNATKIYLTFLGACFAFCAYSTFSYIQDPKAPTLDSLRNQAEEARDREEQARIDREAREDLVSQALYDQCYSEALTLTGARFEEKQRRAFECWKSNTNGTYTGGTAPVPQRSITPSQNVTNQSTVGHNQTGTSRTGSKVQPTGKAQGNGLATPVQSRGEVPQPQKLDNAGVKSPKGKDADYWLAYETAVKVITKKEGIRLKAYPDVKQCSIGYGFFYSKIPKNGKCSGTISQKKADLMLAESLHEDLPIIRSDFPNLHPEAHGALASFKHNCPAGYSSIRKNGLKYFNSWCRFARDKNGNILKKYSKGLSDRRDYEWSIISKKP